MEQDAIHMENAAFAEELYEQWRNDPGSVPPDWNAVFLQLGSPPAAESTNRDYRSTYVYKQSRVDSLVWAYRDVGYLYADLNPLHGYAPPELQYLYKTVEGEYETLTPESFGLSSDDLDTEFRSGRSLTPARGPLRDILRSLKEAYCSYMGVEVLHIQNRTMRGWVIERIEQNNNKPTLTNEKKRGILEDLIRSEELEQFIHSNYIGQKRFSLEGAEALVPALHHLVDVAAEQIGVKEIVLGMAHRGRLNVLTNVMDKPEEEIFSTFEENTQQYDVGGSGDVKYHLGFSTDHVNDDGSSIHISLVANPSHLESVDPVVEGKARGHQRRLNDAHRKKVIPVLIHGDAAFTGQGVVSETFNLAQLRGYKTGGTVHIIVNNQVGFTTASRDARSTYFCTDVAKSMPVPIFHVNGNHPDYVVRAIELALKFRQKFGYDAVVDIVCYRKYGHNEADDPSFTHPIMYSMIENADSVAVAYGKGLADDGVYPEADQKRFREQYRDQLKDALNTAKKSPVAYKSDGFQQGRWRGIKKAYSHEPIETGVSIDMLRTVGSRITTVPDGFEIHRKLRRILDAKRKALEAGGPLDWATAEALAFGSLALEGIPVRLSGEDSGRGTFSQRHAVWWNMASDVPVPYTPLADISPDQARFRVYDSPLSEFSVLGFEYGNALAQPEMLTLWEAQFGDFSNGAQVIIDQFIAAGESKWNRGNGLVLLLPHGYEGQGPEHSSGHVERFLQLCAEDNMQVCNATTPAQYFHLLRRQVKRDFRKPLVIMTPKSLLRHKEAVSSLSELEAGSFREILDDPEIPTDAKTVLMCSGKVFYDLQARRRETGTSDCAILRFEQLYPFPETQISEVLAGYPNAERFVWVQEEPRNRGGWTFMHERSGRFLDSRDLEYVGRKAGASPATGSHAQHQIELERILSSLFGNKEDA